MSTAYSPPRQLDRISWSSACAIVVHLVLLFGIGFLVRFPPPAKPSLEITLAPAKSHSKPEQADFLAQHDQAGSGTLDEVRELTTTDQASPPSDSTSEPATPAAAPTNHQARQTIGSTDTRPATTRPSARAKAAEAGDTNQSKPVDESIETMAAKLDRQRQAYSRRPRIHRMTSVATKKSEDARYQLAWQQRVERVGNRLYPARARQQRLSGDVRLVVSILPDGSIKGITVLVSSGQALLDQAAVNSVRKAAPFEPFPAGLRKKADILEIIRTWQYRNNVLTSSL